MEPPRAATAVASQQPGAAEAKRKRDEFEERKEALPEEGRRSSSSASSHSSRAEVGEAFEDLLTDAARYRARRHAALPDEVQQLLRARDLTPPGGVGGGGGGTGANVNRFIEEAVRRKQAELDRTNHLYKALARKSFQLSVTLLLPAAMPLPSSSPSETEQTLHSASAASASDINRTIVLPAAIQLSKLHKTLQMMLGWQGNQKYMFVTHDGVPIGKQGKDEVPCLTDSRIRLAYLVKDGGDEFYYVYGDWVHRLLVETVGAPRRNIPSTRVIAGSGDCPPDDMSPSSFVDLLSSRSLETPQSFSVDKINMQLMSGQTFYMRIPSGASREHEEQVCLRAMRTPVNILTAPSSTDEPQTVTSSSCSTQTSSSKPTTPASGGIMSASFTTGHRQMGSFASGRPLPTLSSTATPSYYPLSSALDSNPHLQFVPTHSSSMSDPRGGVPRWYPEEFYQRHRSSPSFGSMPSLASQSPVIGSTSTSPIPSSGSFTGFPTATPSMNAPVYPSFHPAQHTALAFRHEDMYYGDQSAYRMTESSASSSSRHPQQLSYHLPQYHHQHQALHQEHTQPDVHHHQPSPSQHGHMSISSYTLPSLDTLPSFGYGSEPHSAIPPTSQYAPLSYSSYGHPPLYQEDYFMRHELSTPSMIPQDADAALERLPPLQSPFTGSTSPTSSSPRPGLSASGPESSSASLSHYSIAPSGLPMPPPD